MTTSEEERKEKKFRLPRQTTGVPFGFTIDWNLETDVFEVKL